MTSLTVFGQKSVRWANRRRSISNRDLKFSFEVNSRGHHRGSKPCYGLRQRLARLVDVGGGYLRRAVAEKPVGEIEPVHVERLSAENDVGGMLGRLMFGDAIAERRQVDPGEHRFASPEHDRGQGAMQLIDQPGAK